MNPEDSEVSQTQLPDQLLRRKKEETKGMLDDEKDYPPPRHTKRVLCIPTRTGIHKKK